MKLGAKTVHAWQEVGKEEVSFTLTFSFRSSSTERAVNLVRTFKYYYEYKKKSLLHHGLLYQDSFCLVGAVNQLHHLPLC